MTTFYMAHVDDEARPSIETESYDDLLDTLTARGISCGRVRWYTVESDTMTDVIAYLRRDIARLKQELAAGTCKSRAFNVKVGALQQRRLDFLIELYPEA